MKALPAAISLLSCLGLAVGAAQAQQQGNQTQQQGQMTAQQLLQQYDNDSNQSLSQEEFRSLYQEHLAASTGQQQNSRSGGQAQIEAMFIGLDTDENEELSTDELGPTVVMISRESAGQVVGGGQQGRPQAQAGGQQQPRSQQSQQGQQQAQAGGQQQSRGQQAQQGQQQAQAGAQQQSRSQQAQQGQQQSQAGGQQRSLEQMARQQPEQLQGRKVQSAEGQDLGEVLEIVESRIDNQLYAVVRPPQTEDSEVVVPINELRLGRMVTLASTGQTRERQAYNEADFVVITVQPAQQGQQGQQQAQRSPGQQGQQQAQAGQGQQGQQGQQQAQAGGQGQQQPQGGQQGQSLEQLAQSQPEQLDGTRVRSSDGEQLGEIIEIVESRSEGRLFAVVRPSTGGQSEEEVVPLEDLNMEDVLVYDSGPNLEQQPYEEGDFQAYEVEVEPADRV